ncbi:hypothetical protein [Roseomonas sp. BN140053]|uniref:hypothetical protein n=1 Tax=Roseomonas sp. BN140053 TaxID=3391898 RepID=UPI0039EC2C31
MIDIAVARKRLRPHPQCAAGNHGPSSAGIRHSRRMSDKALYAFHDACSRGSLLEAWRLLVEAAAAAQTSRGTDAAERRRDRNPIIAGHERLRSLIASS